ncbi:ER-localized membrane protein virion core protein [Eastern grey kangaroopox virus]|uniref:Protein OPG070 n=1 Tax=Eastern grey kangaroopox virus TaxID=2042482 RepID=A0A2C9DT11_9POXV|nr:ER-localized membrane protein virion core protein [Eastern grey kangaroopox virus]ATI21144.1 ER-localized membrane protein virion core protein [Eastern grey kangaroopox virus]ATX75051.1 ER-localized membrane protein, virion core protein [Eastern grey kangaroopox virus]
MAAASAAARAPPAHSVHDEAQKRHPDQQTFYTRELTPAMKNTYLYHDYAYGWIPETAIWNSRYATLYLSDYYPVSIGLLRKLEFMLGLYRGPAPEYKPKVNSEFIANGTFRGRFNDFFQRFSKLPQGEFISFLLLVSMPVYNLLFFFKGTPFDIKKHTLFSEFYINRESHLELARYLASGGDYRPVFSRLDDPRLYSGNLDTMGLRRIWTPASRLGRLPPAQYETLSNLSLIISFTNRDPVLMFLMFYVPGFSATSKITPAVEMLMARLGLVREDIVLI